jgi:glutamate N-acetyltransferase/amino-acid N-acetyltransferase
MALLLANGLSGETPTESELEHALLEVADSLSRQIARDGEGATKLLEIQVTGSANPRRIAESIANSPLVKTAMFGCDPNWGRILMAAGKAEIPFEMDGIVLTLKSNGEDHVLFEAGSPAPFDPKKVSSGLKSDHVIVDLYLGAGESETVYTCDFGYGYVRINAEYHT